MNDSWMNRMNPIPLLRNKILWLKRFKRVHLEKLDDSLLSLDERTQRQIGGRSTKENGGKVPPFLYGANNEKTWREELAGVEKRGIHFTETRKKTNELKAKPTPRPTLIPIRIKKRETAKMVLKERNDESRRVEAKDGKEISGRTPLQIFPSSKTPINFLNWSSYERIFKKSPVPISKVIDETFQLIKTSQDIFNPEKREMFNRELEGEVGVLTGPIEDYREDLLKNALKKEPRYRLKNLFKMGINEEWRSDATNWIKRSLDLIYKDETNEETVHLSIYILDAFLEKQRLSNKRMYMLLAVVSLFIAAKQEEVCCVHPSSLLILTKNKCREGQIVKMERIVFKRLSYEITPPTPIFFLQFSLSLLVFPNKMIKDLVVKLAEELLSLSVNELWLSTLPPSLKASAALEISIEYVMYFYRQATIRVEMTEERKHFYLNENAVHRCFAVFKDFIIALYKVHPWSMSASRIFIEKKIIEKQAYVNSAIINTRPLANLTNSVFSKWR